VRLQDSSGFRIVISRQANKLESNEALCEHARCDVTQVARGDFKFVSNLLLPWRRVSSHIAKIQQACLLYLLD